MINILGNINVFQRYAYKLNFISVSKHSSFKKQALKKFHFKLKMEQSLSAVSGVLIRL